MQHRYACAWVAPSQNMAGVVKKRAWGRSRPITQGVTLLDNTEVEELIKMTVCEGKSSMHATIDLQHPEMISNDELIQTLVQMKVPIPRYDNGEPSRERLIYLFKNHVTPRPQRDRHGVAKKRRRTADCHMDFEPSCDWESSELEPKSRKRYLLSVRCGHIKPAHFLCRNLDDTEMLEPVAQAKRQTPPSTSMVAEQQPISETVSATKFATGGIVEPECGSNSVTVVAGSKPTIVQSVFHHEVNTMYMYITLDCYIISFLSATSREISVALCLSRAIQKANYHLALMSGSPHTPCWSVFCFPLSCPPSSNFR